MLFATAANIGYKSLYSAEFCVLLTAVGIGYKHLQNAEVYNVCNSC